MSRKAALQRHSAAQTRPRGAAAGSAGAGDRVVVSLLDCLRDRFGVGASIEIEDRRPSAYRTSFPIEDLRVRIDGEPLAVLFKDLSRAALTTAARRAKPTFLHDPMREIEVYRRLLDGGAMGTAACYGADADPRRGRYWLFLEKVRGVELYQVGDARWWRAAAAWLAGLHAHFAPRVAALADRPWLLRRDASFYRRWRDRAARFVARRPGLTATSRREFARLARRYKPVIERLIDLPPTLVHGEFYASNVLVRGPGAGPAATAVALDRGGPATRVCPVDWEMAGVGPGLGDLACLVAGRWSDAQREAFLRSYHDALSAAGAAPPPLAQLRRDLTLCRLQTAVQWLGWSSVWTPPSEHAHDWLAEAIEMSRRLEL